MVLVSIAVEVPGRLLPICFVDRIGRKAALCGASALFAATMLVAAAVSSSLERLTVALPVVCMARPPHNHQLC